MTSVLLVPLLVPLLLLITAAADKAVDPEDGGDKGLDLPVACPVHTWCLPADLCDPGYVIYDVKNPGNGESMPEEYVCGATDSTTNYVCCDTQELLPHHFKPTPFHWYFQRKGEESSSDLVVSPWPTFSVDDLPDMESRHDHDDRGDEHDISDNDEYHPQEFDMHEDFHDDGYVLEPDNFDFPEDNIRHDDMIDAEAEAELLAELAKLRERERQLLEIQQRLGAERREGRAVSGGVLRNRLWMMRDFGDMRDKAMPGEMRHMKKDLAAEEAMMMKDMMQDGMSMGAMKDMMPDMMMRMDADHAERMVPVKPSGPRALEEAEATTPPHICPSRSMCVAWNLCDAQHVLYDAETTLTFEFLCGLTDDSELFVCCRRPTFLPDLVAAATSKTPMTAADPEMERASAPAMDPVPAPMAVPEPTPSPAPSPTQAPAPALTPATTQAPEPVQLPLDHLAQIFSGFSPPPHPDAKAAPQKAHPGDDHRHYLKDVLLNNEREKRYAVPSPQGRVIYPSQIAAERLKGAHRTVRSVDSGEEGSAEEVNEFRNTLGGRLKPAGSLGPVKLGGLAPPPRRTSGQPDVRRELPIPPLESPPSPPSPPSHSEPQPPPQPQPQNPQDFGQGFPFERAPEALEDALPEAISVTPRTVTKLDEVDIRPLRAEMWRGQGPEPEGPASRTATGDADHDSENSKDSDPERPAGSVLSRILDSLQGGPASRHGHQQDQETARGQFFGGQPPLPLHRPNQSPQRHGPRPPFHQPPPHQPPHPQQPPQHFQPNQHGGGPGPQFGPGGPQFGPGGPQFDPVHQDQLHNFVPTHGAPPHQEPAHQRPLQHQPAHPQSTSAPRCGRGSSTGLHARITTQRGEDGVAGYGEYPWHVGVLTVDLTYLCAGVLVAPRLVLTVAHCVAPLPAGAPLVVRVGDWDLASEQELYDAYDVEVVRAVVHPDFYAGNLQNDIALLLLDPPVEGLPHVQPACLPPPHAEFAHQHCWVPGWGQARHVSGDLHDPRSYSWVLREAPVAVVPPSSCQSHLRTTHLGPFYQIPRRGVLCAAGRGGSDSCFGDGGGALVCPLNQDGPGGPMYAAGLVSWGIGCGQDIPAVYTKVSDYHGWITSVLEDLERSVQFQFVPGHGAREARQI